MCIVLNKYEGVIRIMAYIDVLDTAVSANRFKIDDCIDIQPHLFASDAIKLNAIKKRLTDKQFTALRRALVRFCFFIELVNVDITSTKFEVHWTNRLNDDIRFSSYDECFAILQKLISAIIDLPQKDFDIIKGFGDNTVIPYELPVDYIHRHASLIHTTGNVALLMNEDVKTCIALRTVLTDINVNPDAAVFKKILSDKIKVKTYLTDRVLTGAHKTNREKRWETHPESVHFAQRIDCMRIESLLLKQVCMFKGVNAALVKNLQRLNILSETFDYITCPITGDIIEYEDFKEDAINPTHGKSKYQVGHLNPLKAIDPTGRNGHTVNNISWISENGNRIQGSLPMEDVDALLRRIFHNRGYYYEGTSDS